MSRGGEKSTSGRGNRVLSVFEDQEVGVAGKEDG